MTVAAHAGTPSVVYDDLGQGEPALLLMTGWCSSRQRWSEVARSLSARHRVVSFEWRGHGESQDAPADFGNREMVEDALAVVEAAGVSSFVACAASHAGWIAIELRRRFPDRVLALVHVDWMVTEPPEPYLQVIEQLRSPEEWAQARDTLYEIWRAGVAVPAVDAGLAEMHQHGAGMWIRSGREISRAYAQHTSPMRTWAALDPPPPVLHVYGQPRAPEFLAAQKQYAVDHPWFRVEHVSAASHFAMLEAPDEVEAAIEGFLAAVCASASRGSSGRTAR